MERLPPLSLMYGIVDKFSIIARAQTIRYTYSQTAHFAEPLQSVCLHSR